MIGDEVDHLVARRAGVPEDVNPVEEQLAVRLASERIDLAKLAACNRAFELCAATPHAADASRLLAEVAQHVLFQRLGGARCALGDDGTHGAPNGLWFGAGKQRGER